MLFAKLGVSFSVVRIDIAFFAPFRPVLLISTICSTSGNFEFAMPPMPEQLLLLAIVMTAAFAYFAITGKLRAYPAKSKWILVSLVFLWVGLLVHYGPVFFHKG
jgi:hypothetical protein